MPSLMSLLSAVVLAAVLLLFGAADASDSGQQQVASIAYLRVSASASAGYENYCAYADPRVAQNLSATFRPTDRRALLNLYPSNGCAPPSNNATAARCSGRTLVVERGGCTYTDKALVAYRLGATGVLVVSSERYSAPIFVSSPPLPANYPVAVISKVAYQSFKAKFLSDNAANAALYRPVSDTPAGSKRFMFLSLYAIAMVAMLLSCVAAATSLKQYLLTRARLANTNLNAASSPPASPTESIFANKVQIIIYIVVLIAVPVCILLLLNFAYDYIVWVMLVLYGYSVGTSLVYYANRLYLLTVESRLEAGLRPWLATTVELDLGKCCGKISWTYMEFFAAPFGLAVAIVWFVFRNSHWAFILTNLLNVLLVMRVIESLSMALRIKIATYLLVGFLIYDVFFVFITPLFSANKGGGGDVPHPTPTPLPSTTSADGALLSRTRRDTVMDYYLERGGSIMERVALGTAGLSGEIIPIVFKVMQYPPPESVLTCLMPYSILGLGDVILPAALLSLNLFFDLAWANRCWPYFISSLIGYLAGLAVCAGVLFATDKGQPALLYIVPLILIASYACAGVRRELKLYYNTVLPDEYRLNDGFGVTNAADEAEAAAVANHSDDDGGNDSDDGSGGDNSGGGQINGDGRMKLPPVQNSANATTLG